VCFVARPKNNRWLNNDINNICTLRTVLLSDTVFPNGIINKNLLNSLTSLGLENAVLTAFPFTASTLFMVNPELFAKSIRERASVCVGLSSRRTIGSAPFVLISANSTNLIIAPPRCGV